MGEALRREKAEETLKRVKAPIDTVLLDDIARGIKMVNRHLEAQVPEGIKDEITVGVSGKTPVPMQPQNTMPPYIRATVFNDGPGSVYVFLNDTKPIAIRQAPLNVGDKLDIDTTEAKINALFFACPGDSDTASVRVHVLK